MGKNSWNTRNKGKGGKNGGYRHNKKGNGKRSWKRNGNNNWNNSYAPKEKKLFTWNRPKKLQADEENAMTKDIGGSIRAKLPLPTLKGHECPEQLAQFEQTFDKLVTQTMTGAQKIELFRSCLKDRALSTFQTAYNLVHGPLGHLITAANCTTIWTFAHLRATYTTLGPGQAQIRINNLESVMQDILMECRMALRKLIHGDDADGRKSYRVLCRLINELRISPTQDIKEFFQRYDELKSMLPYTVYDTGAALGMLPTVFNPVTEEPLILESIISRSPAHKAFLEGRSFDPLSVAPSVTIATLIDSEKQLKDQYIVAQTARMIANGNINTNTNPDGRKTDNDNLPPYAFDKNGNKRTKCNKCGYWNNKGKTCKGKNGKGCPGNNNNDGGFKQIQDQLNILTTAMDNLRNGGGASVVSDITQGTQWSNNMDESELAFVLNQLEAQPGDALEDMDTDEVNRARRQYKQSKILARSFK